MQILHYCARLRLEDGGVVRAVLDLTTALARGGEIGHAYRNRGGRLARVRDWGSNASFGILRSLANSVLCQAIVRTQTTHRAGGCASSPYTVGTRKPPVGEHRKILWHTLHCFTARDARRLGDENK